MKLRGLFLVLGALSLSASAWAGPAQIVIIRHAEKPLVGNDLNAKGVQRANALPNFFRSNAIVDAFGPPVAIYAMNPGGPNGSVRAIHTVTPLAQLLGLTIQENYTRDQIPQLVNEIMSNPAYDDRMVVICWEHVVIPQIAQALGENTAPQSWPDSLYDIAWVFHFTNNTLDGFTMVPEQLLPGDHTSANASDF